MKNKNVLFAVLGIIVLVVLVIGVFYHFRDRRTYTLNLPQLEKLESISLNQNEKDISINDREEMKDILYVLNGTKRVTKNESIQDAQDPLRPLHTTICHWPSAACPPATQRWRERQRERQEHCRKLSRFS